MYLPSRFKVENEKDIFDVVRENPLATLITARDNAPFVSHIPLIVHRQDDQLKLIGHFAKANPHSRMVEGPLTAIFHGPNSYITPGWYEENDVPTWNYVVVHMTGVCRLLPDYDDIVTCLMRLSEQAELNSKNPWTFWLPEDLGKPERLTASIVGFEIDVRDIKAKFKLGQNRSRVDQERVIASLRDERTDQASHQVADWMEKALSEKK